MGADESSVDFPEACLRGLRKVDWVRNGVVMTAAFIPDTRTAATREDRGTETSVSWEDDEKVAALAMSLPHASVGLARLSRKQIDSINAMPNAINALVCERRPEEDNPHHGNIVFRHDLAAFHVTMIAGALALASSLVEEPDE